MTLNYLGECCTQISIQSDGPASVGQQRLGDYEKSGNDTNIYHNILSGVHFIFKTPNGRWMVCIKYRCILLESLIPILFYIKV